MKARDKMEALNCIRIFANDFGFGFYYHGVNSYGITDETGTVNFIITENADWTTAEEGYVKVTLEVKACIATMGSFKTGDELKKQGKVIENAGKLLNTLSIQQNGFEFLTYAVEL